MTIRTQMSWAIDTCSDEGHGFLGRYWLFRDDPLYPRNSVIRTRLFATRREAREMLASMKREPYMAFPHSRVVKVNIIIIAVEQSGPVSFEGINPESCD